MERLYTPAQVSEMLGMSVKTLEKWRWGAPAIPSAADKGGGADRQVGGGEGERQRHGRVRDAGNPRPRADDGLHGKKRVSKPSDVIHAIPS